MTMRSFSPARTLSRLIIVAGLCLAAVPGVIAQKAAGSEQYSQVVKNIAAGNSTEARRKAIETELKDLGIEYKLEHFTSVSRGGREVKGTNIIAVVPNAKAGRTVMLGAHYDRVAVGEGAVDNASGSAAVLSVLKALKANPPKGFAVTAGFWDQEEVGLVGSREFVKSREKGGLPAVYINFDVYGGGDTIWLWSPDPNAEFARNFSTTASAAKFGFLVSADYPPSDHRSFAVPGVQTYSFSLGPAGEAAKIIKLLKGQADPANMPRVMQVIHTENDKLAEIDAGAVVKSLAVVEAAIRTLDK